MQRDLLDALRCPAVHDESWLVAVVHSASGSALIEAELACPVCGAEYRITQGIAEFAHNGGGAPMGTVHGAPPRPDQSLRMAALMGVTDSHLPIALFGRCAAMSEPLTHFVTAPQLLVNARGVPGAVGASRITVSDRLPLGVGTLAAAAADDAHASAAMLDSVARALRIGGRLVAPVSVPVPPGMREIARDAAEWVAETTTRASGLIELRRRAP
jgi:uncharacterized protein YbaR (Trm112 family)